QAALDVLVHLPRLGDDVAATDQPAVAVGGHAAGDEHDRAGAHDVGEVTDGLRHAAHHEFFAMSAHGLLRSMRRCGTARADYALSVSWPCRSSTRAVARPL